MSFITRCPACATAFKVVPDQLKISDGWVRCGHCQHVFDATLDLQPWWPGQEEPAQPPEQPSASSAPQKAPPQRLDLEPEFQATECLPEKEISPPPDAPATYDQSAAPDEPVRSAQPTVEPTEPVEPLQQPSFVRQAQRRAWWRKPWVRAGLSLLVLSLLALLLAQVALHGRDRLAAQVPETKPVLEALCQPISCKVEPPRQLDDVVIDSSVLLRRAPGRYSFNVVIRNKSGLEVAAPALELTLTDISDQVLVRRVLLPADWPQPAQVLAAGSETSVQFDLALEHASDRVMTGYRAILFYP